MPFWEAPDLASMIGAMFSNLVHLVSDVFISSNTEAMITNQSAALLGAPEGGSAGANSGSDPYAARGLCGFALVAGCNSPLDPMPGKNDDYKKERPY